VECRPVSEADVRKAISTKGSMIGTPEVLKEEWLDRLKAKADGEQYKKAKL
jgi:hypothetical protein